MVVHKCLRCGYFNKYKNNVRQHLNKKKFCEPILADITRENCLKFLDTGDCNLGMDLLYKEIQRLKKSCNIVSGDNIITNGNNNKIDNTTVNIHISVNSYDKTDYSVIKNIIHKCIKDGKVDEVKLLKLLHFNDKFPQNHNIKIDNLRDNKIMTYNGEKFELKSKGQDGVWDFIEETLEKTGEELNKDISVNDKHLIAVQNTPIENENLKEKQKRLKINKISNTLYNGKEIVEKTHKT